MKNILITGAAGFIGSFLTEELIKRGYAITGLDNLFRGSIKNLAGVLDNPDFEFVYLDLAEPKAHEKIRKIIIDRKIEVVFHLAAINGTEYFYDSSFMVLDVNTRATQAIISAIEGTSVNYIVYASSSEVYGEPMQIPTPEEHPVLLNSYANRDSYSASKVLGDFYTRIGAVKYNIDFLSIRFFNQYGPRMVGNKYGQVIGEFITRCLRGEDFTIIGDGSHTRSFCFVSDATYAMAELLEKRATGFVNIGNDYEISILELAELIHDKLDLKFNPIFLPERPNDHKRRCPDISLLKSYLPNLKLTPLDEGLDITLEYFREVILK